MSDQFESPIFVLGLPRSGTSMVAGCLQICGAWTGSTVPADKNTNPKGFFEHIVIREHVIKKILSLLGCDPLGVRKLPLINLPSDPPGLTDVIKNIIDNNGYMNDRPWLYKDAKLTLLWPYFLNAFPDAKWVIVKRDIDGFVNSCLRTHFMKQHSTDRKYWKDFAHEYEKRLQALQDSNATVFELYTPDIIAGDFSSLKDTVLQLGLKYDEDELLKFIAPVHWHSKP